MLVIGIFCHGNGQVQIDGICLYEAIHASHLLYRTVMHTNSFISWVHSEHERDGRS